MRQSLSYSSGAHEALPQTGSSSAIFRAASILKDNLTEPPRLQELAKSVGISHPLLNQGFRQHFGTTAFGYLRQLRLEKARRLMAERQNNVTEIAYSVGYESLPSFSRAFSAHFGQCPRNFLAQIRKSAHGHNIITQEHRHV